MTFPGLHALHLRNVVRRATIGEQAAAGVPLVYALRPSSGMAGAILVSPDPSKPGGWRATWFDVDGEPRGHAEAPDCEGAITAAWHMGADIDTAREPT